MTPASIGSLSSAPTMIAPDESNEYSKHIYWVRAEVNYQIRSLCSNQENINPQTQTPQLPQLDHLGTLFFDEALAFLPLGGIALCHRFGR